MFPQWNKDRVRAYGVDDVHGRRTLCPFLKTSEGLLECLSGAISLLQLQAGLRQIEPRGVVVRCEGGYFFIDQRFIFPALNQAVGIFNERKVLGVFASQRAEGVDGGQNFIGTAAPAVNVNGLNKIGRVCGFLVNALIK